MHIVLIIDIVLPSRSAESIFAVRTAEAMTELGHTVELVHAIEPDTEAETEESIFAFYAVQTQFAVKSIARIPAPEAGHFWAHAATEYAVLKQPDLIYTRSIPVTYLSTRANLPTILEWHRDIQPAKEKPHALKRQLKHWVKKAPRRIGRTLNWHMSDTATREKLAPPAADRELRQADAFGAKGQIFSRLINNSHLLRLVVITQTIRQDIETNFSGAAHLIRVVPDGANTVPADIVPETLELGSESLNAGYCGHLYAGKGLETLVRVAPQCPDVRFHIVGGTEQDIARWQKIASDIPNLIFYGYVSPSATARYIAAFDVCLLPNQPSVATYGNPNDNIGRFTSPLKMFEYMAARKPIIASDLPVLREVLVDGENALLRAHDAPEAWAQALKRLSSSPEDQARLGEAAYQTFTERHTWAARTQRALADLNFGEGETKTEKPAFSIK